MHVCMILDPDTDMYIYPWCGKFVTDEPTNKQGNSRSRIGVTQKQWKFYETIKRAIWWLEDTLNIVANNETKKRVKKEELARKAA